MKNKLLGIIILMIIIFSNCVYASNVIVSEETNQPSEEQTTINPDDSEVSTETENKEDEVSSDKENTENNNNNNAENENKDTTNVESNSTIDKSEDKNESLTQQKPSNNVIIKKSSEARLKNLKVDVEGLSPDFDKDTTEYYLVVDLSVKAIKVTAQTLDNKAIYAVYGNKNLKEGENTITIEVTAEDGTKEKYYIYVTKVDDVELANAELETLKVEGFNLYPSFKSNIYSYNLNIDEDIKELNIKVTPQREKATVEIEGNSNLQEGENIIKINVTAEDETTVRTYKINTFINSDTVKIEAENKMPAVVLLIVFGIGILISGIIIIVKNRK